MGYLPSPCSSAPTYKAEAGVLFTNPAAIVFPDRMLAGSGVSDTSLRSAVQTAGAGEFESALRILRLAHG